MHVEEHALMKTMALYLGMITLLNNARKIQYAGDVASFSSLHLDIIIMDRNVRNQPDAGVAVVQAS